MIIKRTIYNSIKPYINSRQVIVVTGMRRVGKTTLMNYIYNRIKLENKLFLDLENTLERRIFQKKDYQDIKFELELRGINFKKQAYLFIDEIQFLKNIPSVVKYFYDHYQIKFFLTGSSSYYLKNQFSESLAGRKYIFELFPLSFKEFLRFKKIELKIPTAKKISDTIHDTYDHYYEEYLRFGGFPEVVLLNDFDEKRKMISDIFSSFFQLEVMQLRDFRKNAVIRDFMLLLMQRAGTKLDISKLSKELSVSRETVYNYLSFLEGTYFIKLIKQYSKSPDVEIRRSPKVYICDSGLLNNLARVDEGTVFENNVFQNLRLKGELNYWQQKNGQEIDFMLNKKETYEVKLFPDERDLKRLARLSEKLKIKNYNIIAKKYSNLENVVYGFMI